MAENPAAWGPAERVVYEAIRQHDDARAAGMIGFSLVMQITTALRKAGLLAEKHNHMTKDIREDCPACRVKWPQYMPGGDDRRS